ncbi:hypothetical protein [Gracilibacillus suaedae]|uniref:hypothetical protein n=1 Tax=Gracilibacillus suaedae TaxID=2820273 RepID=UPI001ABE871D|nr:hypothetical protein [Gracilibacillus suaedae]
MDGVVMNYKFIHIGMLKTATTYMQNIWLKDPHYNLACQGSMDFLLNAKQNVAKRKMKNSIKSEILPDRQDYNNKVSVISNEGFSTSYLNEIPFQELIPDFIKYTSKNLNNIVKTDNLLITIREPVSWIKSVYIQAVKQGWSGSAQEFVNEQETFLIHSLNLKMIIQNYQKNFGNILILPLEFLKENEVLFWQVIADAFNVPVVETRIDKKFNTSLDIERTYILSQMNKMSKILITALANKHHFQSIKEKNNLIHTHLQNEKWIYRRFVENATDQEVSEMYELFNINKVESAFFNFKISDRLRQSIQSNYIDFLRDNTIPQIAEEYQKIFDDYLKSYE